MKNSDPSTTAVAVTPKKDSTGEIPMIDLAEAINFVSAIHEKGLETVLLPEVAKGMGYGNPTSTPFYRRLTAARHFGLLGSSKAELTLRAREYLNPTKEGARVEAMTDAIMGIKHYAAEVQKLTGKKLNIQFVANVFANECKLSAAGASICARVFESSLKTAGFLTPEGLVVHPTNTPAPKTPEVRDEEIIGEDVVEPSKGKAKTHTLPLNKEGTRSISVTAPLDITEKEIKRIQAWLAVTLLVDWGNDETPSS